MRLSTWLLASACRSCHRPELGRGISLASTGRKGRPSAAPEGPTLVDKVVAILSLYLPGIAFEAAARGEGPFGNTSTARPGNADVGTETSKPREAPPEEDSTARGTDRRRSARGSTRAKKKKARSGGRRRRRSKPEPVSPLRPHYATLELPDGADFGRVRQAWRRLVLRHHPDRHAADEADQRDHAERVMAVNVAYRALRRHLSDSVDGP